MKKKAIVYFLVACFILPLLAGCSKKSNEDTSSKNGVDQDSKGKGRYIESEITLTDKSDEMPIVSQLLMQDGSVVIYTADYSKPGKMSLTRYQYDSSKSECKKEAPQWLQNIPIAASPYKVQVVRGTDGTQYLFWVSTKDGGNLYKTSDGKKSVELKLKGWKTFTDNGLTEVFPLSVGVLENGLLVVNTTSGCYLYDIQTGKQKEQVTGELSAEALAVAGNKFAVVSKADDGEETMSAISVYNAENPTAAPEVINFDKPIPLETAITLNKSGDLIIANTEGIHVLRKDTGTWQTMVDGSLNTMYIPDIVCNNVLQDDKENYYIIYEDFLTKENTLMKYHYDKTVSTEPAQELTIYTLKDSTILRAAASAFQKTHPDYKVSIRTAMTDDSALNKEDYIRSLNTELLSGAGCDLILLDELPYEAYVEKGVLTDLSDIVNPMLKDKEVYPNVVNSYYVGDKIYGIPSRVKLPCIFGKAEAARACGTLDGMAEYAKTHKESSLLGKRTYEDCVEEFLPCYMHHIKSTDNKIKADGLKKFLEDIKALNDNTAFIPEYTRDNWKPFCESLSINTSICMDTITQLMSLGLNLSLTNFVDGDFLPLENSYIPANIISINKASKQQKAAKEFIQCMLSDEIQMLDMEWMGLPVKVKALENMKVVKWWEGEYPILKEDGTQINVPLSDLSASDKEKLIGYYKTVTERAYTDDNILKAVKELGKNYVLGNEPIDKTVDLIMNKLSIYNEE